MADAYRSGPVTVTVDQRAVLAMLNRFTEGAASRVVAHADRYLRGIEVQARALAPVRSGLLRDSFRRTVTITSAEASVVLSNDAPYVTKARFAGFKRGTVPPGVQREAERLAADARVAGDADKQRAVMEHVYRRNAWRTKRRGAPTDALVGKHVWTELVRKPYERGLPKLIDAIQADLLRLAGEVS